MKIDDEIQSKFINPQTKAIVNIRYTANLLNSSQNAFFSEFDLTFPQFNILRILRGAEKAINVQNVKSRMVEKSPNITRIMDKLVAKNLISRKNCIEDKRSVYIEITIKGLDVLSEIDFKIKKSSITPDNLSDKEAETLSELLDKVRIGIKQNAGSSILKIS